MFDELLDNGLFRLFLGGNYLMFVGFMIVLVVLLFEDDEKK